MSGPDRLDPAVRAAPAFVPYRPRTLGSVAVLLLLFLAALAGCGGGGAGPSGDGGPRPATLILDYLPNGVHAGIYRAIAAGYYEDQGIDLDVVTPTSTADTLRLIQAGKADFGLADGIDVATQVAAGRDVKALAALTQRPSGGLITLRSARIRAPADLAGATVGVTGLPSDRAVFDTMVRADGGDPARSRVVTIGFNGVQALMAGRIAAFTGYIPADATAIRFRGKPTRSFAFDRFGGPSYPGLVFFSTARRIAADPDLMDGFVTATLDGYRDALAAPDRAVNDLVERTDGIDPELGRATFRAYRPFIGSPDRLGRIRPAAIRELSGFLLRNGLITRPVTPARFGPGPGPQHGPNGY